MYFKQLSTAIYIFWRHRLEVLHKKAMCAIAELVLLFFLASIIMTLDDRSEIVISLLAVD